MPGSCRPSRWAACLVVVGLALMNVPAGADDAIGGDMIITKGMKPWEGCGECHSLDGVAPNPHFPNLAAQKPAYFRKQMEDFRDGKRQNDHGQMGTSSRELTNEALAKITAYFAGLEPPPAHPPADIGADERARARRLFEAGSRGEKIPPCTNCHSDHPKHDFIAACLEAQPAGYTAKQLQDFKAGRRANDPDQVMQKIAHTLSDDDIAALSVYLAGLAPGTGAACIGAAQ